MKVTFNSINDLMNFMMQDDGVKYETGSGCHTISYGDTVLGEVEHDQDKNALTLHIYDETLQSDDSGIQWMLAQLGYTR